jgi:hypothetical protein
MIVLCRKNYWISPNSLKFLSVKMTKQHIFIIENNLQKIGQSFFHLSRRTTMIQDLLVRHQFSLVSDKLTKIEEFIKIM